MRGILSAMKELKSGYDVIGDIHGRYDKLLQLMERLDYRADGDGFIPPPGRTALFLGDLIDPKQGHPAPGGVKNTLTTVKAMIDSGHALCLMGNHEFNALRFHTTGPNGNPLQPHDPRNVAMHQGTLDDFPDHEDPTSEWRTVWMPWMARLPLFLDLGGLRAVHACWHAASIRLAAGVNLAEPSQLIAAARKDNPTSLAVHTILKGIEVPLPKGYSITDDAGTKRKRIRARWWEEPRPGDTCRDLIFPMNDAIPDTPLEENTFGMFEPYAAGEPPIFFGHYLKKGNSPLTPEKPNVACLDHAAAKNGPLVAYRWQGETTLNPDHYVAANLQPCC